MYDETGAIWDQFGVIGQPSWIFVNDDGTIVTQPGGLGEDGIRQALADLEAT